MAGTDELSKEDIDDLRHMLGMNYKKRDWGFRNYYAAGIDSDAERSMDRLVCLGYVRKGRNNGTYTYYHVTEKGCIAVGLTPSKVAKALKGAP